MQGFDTRYIRGDDLIPISWEMARSLLKPKADDDDYFTVALHVLSRAAMVLDGLQKRLKPEDLTATGRDIQADRRRA